jgi:hypothetical protein
MNDKNNLFDLDINLLKNMNALVLPKTKMYDKQNKLFDLAIKGEGHSDLILISETPSCLNAYTYNI